MEVSSSLSSLKQDECKWFDLRPNRQLLDVNFDGYKLSLDSFDQYKLSLAETESERNVDTFNLVKGEHQQRLVVYQHLKLFSFQNLLFVNVFKDSFMYYFDACLRLTRINYARPTLIPSRQIVPTSFQIPNHAELLVTNGTHQFVDRVCVTMKFVSETVAVIFDGYDTIYVCDNGRANKTDDDLSSEEWTVLLRWRVNASDMCLSSIIKDACQSESQIDLLLMNVRESERPNEGAMCDTFIHWLTIDTTQWQLARTRRLNCFNVVPDYVSLERGANGINIAGPSSIRFVYDSMHGGDLTTDMLSAKESVASEMDAIETVSPSLMYTWNQNESEVNVNVVLKSEIRDKSQLNVQVKSSSLDIFVDGASVFSKQLHANIKTDECVWTLASKNTIDFVLFKVQNQVWPCLLRDGDATTSEVPVLDEESKPVFSLDQQLEECDGVMDEQMVVTTSNDEESLNMLRRIDGTTHKTTHKCFINDQKVLFDIQLAPNESAALCLRHDVDGIVWQPKRMIELSSSEWLRHEHTFLAFGYVQASKREAKFTSCPPDKSYVAICDTQKHVYVYKQSTAVDEASLRNRKTGQQVKHVARQYLISLDSDKEILGFYCSNQYIIVLTYDSCYFYKLKSSN